MKTMYIPDYCNLLDPASPIKKTGESPKMAYIYIGILLGIMQFFYLQGLGMFQPRFPSAASGASLLRFAFQLLIALHLPLPAFLGLKALALHVLRGQWAIGVVTLW